MAVTRRAGTVQKYSVANTVNVQIPPAAVVGDIAILSFDGPSAPAVSGWTMLTNQAGASGIYLWVFWKTIAAGDPGNNATITGALGGTTMASMEVWSGVKSPPTATNALTAGVWPSATAAVGSVPLYVGAGYSAYTTIAPPASVTPPAGLGGNYLASGTTTSNIGVGAWFGNPTTGTTAPSVTFGFTAGNAMLATIILPPAQTQNAYIAGSTSAGDVLCSVVLAGSTSSADTTLLWTP